MAAGNDDVCLPWNGLGISSNGWISTDSTSNCWSYYCDDYHDS